MKHLRFKVVGAGAAVSLLALGAYAQDPTSLTVVSWGGAYSESQQRAYLDPYMEENANIRFLNDDGSANALASLRAQSQANNVTWDLVDMLPSDAQLACDEGIIMEIDADEWLAPAPDGTPASEDFLPGSLGDCFIPQIVYSTVIGYNTEMFDEGKEPSTIADFFNPEEFPGKRAIQDRPAGNLEWALYADGVPLDEIYETLETPEGVDRAFAKLDTIKDSIVWWEAGAQAPQLLASGEVAMTTAWNGRIYNANKEGKDFRIVWDNQILDSNYWVIPKGAKNPEASLAFIKYAAEPKVLAGITKYIPYGPVRKSAAEFVAPEDAKNLPTSPQNLTVSLTLDNGFWADNGEEIRKRFTTWLAQ